MSALSRIKNWVTLEVLTADDLNAEFNNIVDNVESGADVTDATSVAAAGAAMENNATLHVNKDYSSGDEDASIDFNNSQAIFKWKYLSNMAVSNFDLNKRLQQQWTFSAATDFDNTSQNWAHLIQMTLNYPDYVSDVGKYTSSSPVLVYLDQNINDFATYQPEVSGVQAFVSGLTANSKAGMYGAEFVVSKGNACTQDSTVIAVDGVITSEVDPVGAVHYGCGFRAYTPAWSGHSPVRQHTAFYATGSTGWKYGFLYKDTDDSTLCLVDENGVGFFAGNLSSAGAIEAKPTSGNAAVHSDAPTGSDSYFILEENNVTKGYFAWDGAATTLAGTGMLYFRTASGGATRATLDASGNLNVVGNITAGGTCCGGGGIDNIVEDLTPQLGGNLDMNGNSIGGNTEAQLDDAVTKKHTINGDTALGAQTEDLNMNTHKVIGVTDPTTDQHAATKKYVDDKHVYSNKPTFSAYITSNLVNVTGDDTDYPLNTNVWTEFFDQGSDFVNGVFTAPVTGKYLFTGAMALYNIDGAHTLVGAQLMTTSANHEILQMTGAGRSSDNYLILTWSWFKVLSAGQTAYLNVNVKNGTKTVGIMSTSTTFSGALIC